MSRALTVLSAVATGSAAALLIVGTPMFGVALAAAVALGIGADLARKVRASEPV